MSVEILFILVLIGGITVLIGITWNEKTNNTRLKLELKECKKNISDLTRELQNKNNENSKFEEDKKRFSKQNADIAEREKEIRAFEYELYVKSGALHDKEDFLCGQKKDFVAYMEKSREELGKEGQQLALDCFDLYPEFRHTRKDFSISTLFERYITIDTDILYEEFVKKRFEKKNEQGYCLSKMAYGYVYAMYNKSMPCVVKIGCSEDPRIRAKELTTGENFRNNKEYAKLKNADDKYSITKVNSTCNALHEYVENLNIKLKTSLPSPFIVAFHFEILKMFEDECLLHYLLRDFNIHRGAGTEFFTLTLQETYRIFKMLFPRNPYQLLNFTPVKRTSQVRSD